MSSPYSVIGISGITNGGKTTLTEKLLHHIPGAEALYLDDYFWLWPQERDKFIWLEDVNHANWEDASAVNFESLHKDVVKWVSKASANQDSKHPVLLVDGFILYSYPPLIPYFTKKYFLTLDEEECRKRRKGRNYDPPDPPQYFEKCVWPMYIKHIKEIENVKDIVYIDGKLSKEEVFAKVEKDITDLMHRSPGKS